MTDWCMTWPGAAIIMAATLAFLVAVYLLIPLRIEEVNMETGPDAVRELHARAAGGFADYCSHCSFAWPCPTMQALDALTMDERN